MLIRRQNPVSLIHTIAAHRLLLRWLFCLAMMPVFLSSCGLLDGLFKCRAGSFGYEEALPDDAFTPNDSIAKAAPIVSELDATLRQKDQPDHFKFAATALQRIKVNLKRTSGHFLEPQLEVMDVNGVVLGHIGKPPGATDLELEVTAPKDGQYVLRVSGAYSGPPDSMCAVAQLSYRLSLSRP